jgi:hypothetical protein
MLRKGIREFGPIFFPQNGILAFFPSPERFGTEFREFSVLRNGSERNSKSLLQFLFHGTEFKEHSSPLRNSSDRNSDSFLFRGTAGTNQMFRLFRLPRNNFFVGNCQPNSRIRPRLGMHLGRSV